MTTTADDAVRAEVRAEMARKRLTNQALAAATGKHPQTVGNILNGTSPFPLAYAFEVCSVLGVDLVELMTRAARSQAEDVSA